MSTPTHLGDFAPPAVVARWQRRALGAAIPFTVAAVIGWALTLAGDDQFWQHVGDLTISPGTPLDVDVRCGDAPSPRRRGTVFLASARPSV